MNECLPAKAYQAKVRKTKARKVKAHKADKLARQAPMIEFVRRSLKAAVSGGALDVQRALMFTSY